MNQNIMSAGLLIIRVGLGLMMVFHGYPKVFGGVESWENLGSVMSNLGINQYPIFFGAAAAFSEFIGGILLVLGIFTRPAAFLLACTMFVAATKHYFDADGVNIFRAISYPTELFFVFLGLVFTGPGSFSVSDLIRNSNRYEEDDFEEY